MEIKVGGVTRKEFDENALWVVKFIGHRDVGTYPYLEEKYGKGFFSRDDVRDVDLLCDEGQPDILKSFIEKMHEIDREHGWMTIPEIFDRFGVSC